MKTCPNCNVTVTSEQRRCGNCGYALTPTHVSAKRTEPIHSPPPTYIPPPSPHPPAQSGLFPAEVKFLLRPRLLITGVILLAIIGYMTYLLTRPPQLSGQWYGMLRGQGTTSGASGIIYAEGYLNLQVNGSGVVTGTGEFCALTGNLNESLGHRSPFTITGHMSGSHVTLTLTANRFGGSPGSTNYLGSISGQHLGLQLQTTDASAAGIGMDLQQGSRSNYEAACAA